MFPPQCNCGSLIRNHPCAQHGVIGRKRYEELKEIETRSLSGSTVPAGYASLLADYRRLRDAAKCIKHWHDTHNGGMIVSGQHVFKLWEALEETQEA